MTANTSSRLVRLPGAVSAGYRRLTRLPALILLAALFATGCVSEEEEQQLGDTIAADINAQVPLVRDPVLLLYLNQLGERIAEVSERPDVPYRFYIINSPNVNAFALPGGHIYVTRGLLERTRNIAELAGVLAHEVGHVAARHGAQALERELRTGSLVSLMYSLFLRGEPSILERDALQIGGRLWFASHSRAAEREADDLAVRYMINAGLDPDGMITMLEGLLEEEGEEEQMTVEWFSTHPLTQNRIDLLQRRISRINEEIPPDLVENVASYSEFIQRVRALPPPIVH